MLDKMPQLDLVGHITVQELADFLGVGNSLIRSFHVRKKNPLLPAPKKLLGTFKNQYGWSIEALSAHRDTYPSKWADIVASCANSRTNILPTKRTMADVDDLLSGLLRKSKPSGPFGMGSLPTMRMGERPEVKRALKVLESWRKLP